LRETHKVVRESTGVSERELTAWMIRNGWAQRLGNRLAPASYGERTGYVTSRLVEWSDATGTQHTRPELRVTTKGVARLARAFSPDDAPLTTTRGVA
jgi:phage antirepressor YoqD-like protein